MDSGVISVMGGLGLFLLGMAVMTDGLKSLAQASIRALLARFTRSPLSGAVTGAISTAMIQSSSATTVAAVGFVSAGLLTFPQSLGIIFGANIGTTMTGWLVALFGFKLPLGQLMLPTILIGVLLRMFSKGSFSSLGSAIAGFGLIFVGIDALQSGMAAYSDVVTPASFPADTLAGRLLLVLLGVVITLITQSSSAGVAMALTAVNAGNITLPQAAAMVIGMDVGTTATALLATIGGNVQARRTGAAHVVYNLLTAVGAFALLSPYLLALEAAAPRFVQSDPELVLVAFHSLFNTLGVVAVLPFTRSFAALIERIVPERGNPLTRRLDARLQQTPELAVGAVQATVGDLVSAVFVRLANVLRGAPARKNAYHDNDVRDAVKQTEHYLRHVYVATADPLHAAHAASIHILDHLRRLLARMDEPQRLARILAIEELAAHVDRLAAAAVLTAADPRAISREQAEQFQREYHALKSQEKPFRRENIALAAQGRIDADTAIARTDAVRGLRRIGYHVWRIIRHLHAAYATDASRDELATNV